MSTHHSRCSRRPIFIPAVPFCHLTFLAVRPPIRRYERVNVHEGTLGDRLRQRRWRAKLEQADVARMFGVSKDFYRNWEMNRRSPSKRYENSLLDWLNS